MHSCKNMSWTTLSVIIANKNLSLRLSKGGFAGGGGGLISLPCICPLVVKRQLKRPGVLKDITPYPPATQNFSVRVPARGDISVLKLRHFLTCGYKQICFGPFLPGSTHFLQHFQDIKKQPKNENMMPCTRLYLESTETLMVQGSKTRLLILPKGLFEKIFGYNSFLIIIISKGRKQAF